MKKQLFCFNDTLKVDNIEKKRSNNEKLTYDEFETIVLSNDEIEFSYKDNVYEIIHDESVMLYEYKYANDALISESCIGKFVSSKELLRLTKIDGKSIKELWNDMTFKSYYGKY